MFFGDSRYYESPRFDNNEVDIALKLQLIEILNVQNRVINKKK